jgi:hypothetical protein
MAKQTAKEALSESIHQLEIRQAQEGEELKAQFRNTYESLKLVNLVKSSIKDITESIEIRTSLFESIVSVLSGFVTKKLMVSSKSNPFMKIIGLIMQFGLTNLVSKNAETIREYITQLIDKFFHPKEAAPETEAEA